MARNHSKTNISQQTSLQKSTITRKHHRQDSVSFRRDQPPLQITNKLGNVYLISRPANNYKTIR